MCSDWVESTPTPHYSFNGDGEIGGERGEERGMKKDREGEYDRETESF